MKVPDKTLPEVEALDRLGDVAKDHLIVINKAWTVDEAFKTSRGMTTAINADVWVYDDNAGGWKQLGDTPIFWKTVQRQIQEGGADEPQGAILRQGTKRDGGNSNPNEWWLDGTMTKDQSKLLTEWTDTF